MGKVIRGSAQSSERYVVAIPALAGHAVARDDSAAGTGETVSAFSDDWSQLDAAPERPAAPAIDLAAIAAQAQELVDDAARDAETLVDDARERARLMLEEAKAQAELLAEDARRSAHDDGYAAGAQAAQAEVNDLLTTMRELVEATRDERHALISAAEPEIVRLAAGIAERVLHQQITLDRGVVVEMAKAAIARLVDRETIVIRVNPGDVERMREHRDDLLALGDVKTMRVIEDQRVDRGGVIIETDAGSIDAKISTQLAEVRKILHIVDDVVVQPATVQTMDDADYTAARAS